MSQAQILLNGQWVDSSGTETFQAVNPTTGEKIGDEYPISPWSELEHYLANAQLADEMIRNWPGERFAEFLNQYADNIEKNADEICEIAHQETGLPLSPRLRDGELPRTVAQLRKAAAEAKAGDWALPVIDEENNIRSIHESLGPVLVIGPNNFPLAFNGISGGDFAAAIAAGNPVLAKGHPAHPGTTRLLAQAALDAADSCNFPAGFVQLVYHLSNDDGLKMVRDKRVSSLAFTGSQAAGVALKAAADETGKPAYLEMSSINPVFVLPDYLKENSDAFAEEFTGSCLMGSGQFCTNPGLIILPPGEVSEQWVNNVRERFSTSNSGPLLTEGVKENFLQSIKTLRQTGAELLTGGEAVQEAGFRAENTLLKTTGESFLNNAEQLQKEAFGNSSLVVITDSQEQMTRIAQSLEGQLTGCLYATESAEDEAIYQQIEPVLRRKVGRLLNQKMPTGVAVSPAMNHGGPFPATGHPGFTAVGLPASIRRFSMLACYDNVPQHRLPDALKS